MLLVGAIPFPHNLGWQRKSNIMTKDVRYVPNPGTHVNSKRPEKTGNKQIE